MATAFAFVMATPASAQFAPVFQLQPGLQISDFVSVPSDETETNSAFSVRVSTRFPTSVSWLMPVVGAFFLPYGTTENTVLNTDAPTLFAGNIFSVVPPARTSGWISVEVPLLITHSPGAGRTGSARDYGRDLVVAPAIYVHVGARGLRDLGTVWSRLLLYAQFEQNLTPNRDVVRGERDYFNPIATFGASLRVGGQE
jgi:hypothetical protein